MRLALAVLGHQQPVAEVAARFGVSRKFCFEQARIARRAIQRRFLPPPAPAEPVLFHVPVTASWLRQFTIGLSLTGHTSVRGIVELMDDLLDYHTCVGSVQNILKEAAAAAREFNRQEDARCLPAIAVGAHDEIFQGGRPVLVGLDVDSLYCYLLSAEEHRDEVTWAVRLLELSDQGLKLQRSIADFGQGMRAGQKTAWGNAVRCDGDLFHGLRPLMQLVVFLENRAWAAMEAREQAQKKVDACGDRIQVRKLWPALNKAKREEAEAIALADAVAILARWVREEVLGLAGEDRATRLELLAFIVEQLRQLEPLCEYRIRPVRRKLEEQGESLVAFAGEIDRGLAELAAELGVEESCVRAACRAAALKEGSELSQQRHRELAARLGAKWGAVAAGVQAVLSSVARSSSMVENLNGRLRCYLFLRRQVGNDALELLRFYFNHRILQRSRRKHRQGKSPAQLLRGGDDEHWLEKLGYKLFHRA